MRYSCWKCKEDSTDFLSVEDMEHTDDGLYIVILCSKCEEVTLLTYSLIDISNAE